MQERQNGFALIEGLLILAVLGAVTISGWWIWHRQVSSKLPEKSTTGLASPLSSSANTSGTYWLIEDWAVAELQKAGMSTAELNYFFNNPHTLLIHQDISTANSTSSIENELPDATMVNSFAGYTKLQQAFSDNTISSAAKYLLYDNENWSATPAGEQADPIGYEQKAAALAHQHGKKLIFTPAADLTHVLAGTTGDAKYSAYLSLGIAAKGAAYADIFEIQAQQAEGQPDFSTFVSAAVSQITHTNPHCTILVGIGSNPAGRTVSAQTILGDYNSVKQLVNGFWFNIPGKNPQPQVALDFFNTIYQQSQP